MMVEGTGAPAPQSSGSGGGSGLLYALLGCAGVCLLGLCGATGVAAYLVVREGGAVFSSPGERGPGDPGGKPPSSGPIDPSTPGAPPAQRLRVAASVVSVSGNVVPNGSRCLFDVEPPAEAQAMCRAQVVCGGQLVYGGQSAGYFPCESSPGSPPRIAGRDDQTTTSDGDGAMAIDTAAGTLVVRDDERGPHGAFTLEARIESVE